MCSSWKSRSWILEEKLRGTDSKVFEFQCEVSVVYDDVGGLMFMEFLHCILSKVNKANYQEI